MTKSEIKKETKEYIFGWGNGSYGWYIGIAEDPRDRLFNDHNVEEEGAWIYCLASSSDVAREIEDELIDELNTKGDTGGGSDKTKYVYAYRINSTTKE